MAAGTPVKSARNFFCESCGKAVTKDHLRHTKDNKGHIVIEERHETIRWTV